MLDAHSLEVLGERECLNLLGHASLGRVALCFGALPAIFPVHFSLLGRDPVFRTEGGSKLTAASAGQVLCLEVDHADPESHTGWSVMVTGIAQVLTGLDLELAQSLPLRPWVGTGDAYVRIHATLLSGRRVHPAHASDPRPV